MCVVVVIAASVDKTDVARVFAPQHNKLLGKTAFIIIGTTGKKGLIFASQETKAQSVNVLFERSLS